MDETTYRGWRRQVDDHLPTIQADPPIRTERDRLTAQLAAVLEEAERIARAIEATLPNGGLVDKNKYDFVRTMLPRIVDFEDFVIGEYTYELPGRARPGIRLLSEVGAAGRQVAVMMFEDVRRWQVDPQGHKVAYQLLALLLDREPITPHVAAESSSYYTTCTGWRQHLREALCLPVHLIDEG